MRRSILTVLVLQFLATACASAGSAGAAGGRADLLVEEQIRDQSFTTTYDAVVSLRPNWLRTRGVDSFRAPTQIQVYLDNMRMGGVNTLQQIPASAVYWIRWYDGIDASARWGLDHGQGVIYVSTTPEQRSN